MQEIVAKRKEAAKTRQDRTLLRALKNNLNAKEAIVRTRLHETTERCNTDKCICYCSKEDNFPDLSKKSPLGHRKKDKSERANYHKAERPNVSQQQQKRPTLQRDEERPRDSILSTLINHFPSYQEGTIPNIHHHVSVPYKAQIPSPEIMGNLRSNGVPYHVPTYDGQNILLANSHYPHIHHNLYSSPLNVGKGQTDDDYIESYDQGDYFESYDQFEDHSKSHDPVVASGQDQDLAEVTTTVPNDDENDASVESKTNYSTEKSGAVEEKISTVDFSSATETSTSEESVDRVKQVYRPTDNLLDSADEARVSMKKLADETTDRTTEIARSRLLGKSKSKTNKLLLIPNEDTNVVSSAQEEITEKVVAEKQTEQEQREVVAASYDTVEDDDSSTTNSRLPLCDNTLLLNSIRKAIDDFALDPRTKENSDETQNALPEILRVSNLKNILSKPQIEDEIVERVKDILSASTSVSRRDFANDWSHSVIRNTLRSVVDAFHGIHQKLSPVEKHETTDEMVSSPVSTSNAPALNPGNLMLNISDQVTNKIKDPTIRDRLNSVFQMMRDAAKKEASKESVESDKEETSLRKTEDNSRITKNKSATSGEDFDPKEHKNVKNNNYQKAKILKNNADILSSYEYSESLKNLSESVNLSEENVRIEEQIPNRVEKQKENIGNRVSDEMRKTTNARDDEDETLKSSIVYQQANSQSNHEVLTISAEQHLTENGDHDEKVAATPENSDASLDREQNEIVSEDATDVEDKTESSASTTSSDNLIGNANRESQEESTSAVTYPDHIEPLIILERIRNKEPPIKYYPRESSEDTTTIYNSDDNDRSVTNDAYSVQLFPSSSTSDDISELQKSQLYYINDDTKFPLEIRQMNDGSYALQFTKDICEHFLQKECPCCVPRTGHVIRSDQEEAILTTEKRDDDRENARANDNRVRKTMMRKTRNTLKTQKLERRPSNDLETVPMSVTDFAEKYNLLLDFDNKEMLGQTRGETQSYDEHLLKKSVRESNYDQSEEKNSDNNHEVKNILQKNEDEKTAHTTGSFGESNFVPKRSILSEEETEMNKLPNIEEGKNILLKS